MCVCVRAYTHTHICVYTYACICKDLKGWLFLFIKYQTTSQNIFKIHILCFNKKNIFLSYSLLYLITTFFFYNFWVVVKIKLQINK